MTSETVTVAGERPANGTPLDHTPFGDLPLAVAGARVMLEQLERIEAHEAGSRSGDDPEDVHRMRVATRRLRAARRVFGKAMAGQVDLDRANEELRTLAAALGQVRDLDVFAIALRKHAAAAPADDRPALERMIAAREQERDAAQAALGALLDGGAVTYLRTDFHQALHRLATSGDAKGSPVRRAAPRLIVRALERLYQEGEELQAPTSTELHDLRITAKRARYAAEFFAPAYGDRLTEPIARLTAVQDTLGEIHDTDVAIGVLLGVIESVSGDPERAPDAAPIARLIARYVENRDASLATFRDRWETLPRPRKLRRALEGST